MSFKSILGRPQSWSFRVKSAMNSMSHFDPTSQRFISCTSSNKYKEIRHKETETSLTIEGIYKESPRKNYLIKFEDPPDAKCKLCPMCKFGVPVRHTDVLILSQFVTSKGKLIPKKITGLCKEQHNRMKYLVLMAQKAGLMPMFEDGMPKGLSGWEANNKYYDEIVIDDLLNGKRNKA